eukprot:3960909-Alexandrium_andersonii.AAC.1
MSFRASVGSLREPALPDPWAAGALRLDTGSSPSGGRRRPRLRCVPSELGACDWSSTDACSLRARVRSSKTPATYLNAAPSWLSESSSAK